MWIIASIYIVCVVAAIILYFLGCSKIAENDKVNLKCLDSIKLFKLSLGILILGFLFLILGLIIRIIA